MGRPEVSVVVPTKDRHTLVRRTVQSTIDQTDVDVEIVVVDDGSSQPVATSLDDLKRDLGDRLQVLRNHQSLGVAGARNRGLQVATAPWVGFCDDDDLWAPGKLRDQLEAVDGVAPWACSGSAQVDDDLRVLALEPVTPSGDIVRELLAGNVMAGGGSNVMALTDRFRKLGGFDPTLSTLADWDAWIRLASTGPLVVVPRYHVAYAMHPNNMSLDVDLLWADLGLLLDKHSEQYDRFDVAHNRVKWRKYIVKQHLRNGARLSAAKELLIVAPQLRSRADVRHLTNAVRRRIVRSRQSGRLRQLTPTNIEAIAEAERWLTPHRTNETSH